MKVKNKLKTKKPWQSRIWSAPTPSEVKYQCPKCKSVSEHIRYDVYYCNKCKVREIKIG